MTDTVKPGPAQSQTDNQTFTANCPDCNREREFSAPRYEDICKCGAWLKSNPSTKEVWELNQ